MGQTSYTKILQDRFGIVKKFYKQQEGLTDKGMISPMEKSPIRTKTALERFEYAAPSDCTYKTFQFQKYIACSHFESLKTILGI